MSEEKWLASENLRDMLQFLRNSPQGTAESMGRKYRLFACACVRQHAPESEDGRGLAAVAIAERFADGCVTREELAEARSSGVTGSARKTLVRSPRMAANDVCGSVDGVVSVALLRCVVGNPFRPVSLESVTLTAEVLSLAQAAYDERLLPSGELEADRLAVLSDALEESGCDDASILAHLRSPGLHVRGCHVIDAILWRK